MLVEEGEGDGRRPRREAPVTLNPDFNPTLNPAWTGSAALAWAPGPVVAAVMGMRAGGLTMTYHDAAAAMVSALAWPLDGAPADSGGPGLWYRRVGMS
jgi:hypothetical protein